MKKKNINSDEIPGMTAEQIRELREQERMDSVCFEPPASKKALFVALNYAVSIAAGALMLFAFYYVNILIGFLRSEIQPSLYAVDNSAGFLTDLITGILNTVLFGVIAVLFGFALDINYSGRGRPREVWGSSLKFILPAAFGSCLVYSLISNLADGSVFSLSGSILSKCLYYLTMIVVVPSANVLLYLVLPSAVMRILLTLVSDTKENTELPLTVTSAAVMAIAMLGITPGNIENFGLTVALFTLLQSALCSILYHRTNVIRYTILMHSGVSALYLALAALIDLFM